jgi:predicted XRE-type DNA-binding protein
MKRRPKMEKSSGNVFRDIGFPPGEAQNLLLRAEMMLRVEDYVKKSGLTQQAAARTLGVTQPRLNLLLKRRIELFSLDALVNMLAKAGMRVELKVKQAA